jgi:nitrite reductase/ring-hydroxylating ferredoxin subunit
MTEQTALVALCDTADVTDDLALRVELDGQDYAVYVYDGQYYVTQDLCSHGPGFLSDGFVEGCEVECPFHQGRFNFITGEPSSAPCTDALKIWAVTVQDGKVWIDPTAGTVA